MLKKALLELLHRLIEKRGYGVVRLAELGVRLPFTYLWRALTVEQRAWIGPHVAYSKSQIAQDLFVISVLQHRELAPFFVEFGAADGIRFSNTHIFEKCFGWKGILAEPGQVFHPLLAKSRKCIVDARCVTDRTGDEVEFVEIMKPDRPSAYFAMWSHVRQQRSRHPGATSQRSYHVETVSLNDLLAQHDAPRHIGYLSIDTEGSELQILKAFDFAAWTIDVITVEHNYENARRAAIHDLLSAHGFVNVHRDISQFDDWYVRA